MSAPAGPPQGVLHDLGYQPYRGERLPQARRFMVIARNVVAIAWRQKWGVRLPVMLTGLVTIIGCVLIYVIRYATKLAGPGLQQNPMVMADRVVLETSTSLGLIAFVLGIRVGCTSIADDLRVGAYQFYFSRTIRPSDYLIGKLLGIALVMGIPLFGAPVVLALFRVLLSDNLSEAWKSLHMVPGAVLFGVAGTAAYAFPAAGCGALMQKRLASQAFYAGFYFVGTFFLFGLAEGLDAPIVRALEPGVDVVVIGQELFGVRTDFGITPPLWAAVAALCGYAALSAWLVHRRVARAETSGMGGG
jgi:ABC-2 type transport system permease protein